MAKSHHHYNPSLKQKAKALRGNMTKAEACIWKYVLKARQLLGYSFKRQRPIDYYIVDFVCLKLKLVIEVDGITHSYEGAEEKDRVRQNHLERVGFHVIRFSDDEVLTAINQVKQRLESVVDQLERKNILCL